MQSLKWALKLLSAFYLKRDMFYAFSWLAMFLGVSSLIGTEGGITV